MYLGREFEEMCAQMYYRGKMFGELPFLTACRRCAQPEMALSIVQAILQPCTNRLDRETFLPS